MHRPHRLAARFATLAAAVAAAAIAAAPALAHVTPNVALLKRGEFVKQSLPAAAEFFEQKLAFGAADVAAIKSRTRWTPSEEDVKVYLGRDAEKRLAGSALFLWVPSEHGPVGIAVAFDPAGKILRAAVTDVGSEPLAWVRPLVQADGMAAFAGLPLDATPDPAKVAPGVTGNMSRYYAEVIAEGVTRAQAVERVSLAAAGQK
ncbi:MAG TPA: hypothetical protein VHB47_06965 [Thermoanaerobaculia bacterium]|jgi:hypothetical protein|nr:hypothetical protein [Thermoanaerobaculia bacterium]